MSQLLLESLDFSKDSVTRIVIFTIMLLFIGLKLTSRHLCPKYVTDFWINPSNHFF